MKNYINSARQILEVGIYTIVLIGLTGLSSCKKYLDIRPDKQQVVPSSLLDLQAILDNATVMNRSYPSSGEAASDNYYLAQTDYNALQLVSDKTIYIWQKDGTVGAGQWLGPYQVVYYANQALESLATIAPQVTSQSQQIKGAALFFRGYAFFQVASLFAEPYNPQTAATDWGIPLRLTADFNPKSTRASVQQTYDQIIADLKQAASLLPLTSPVATRPNRMAAYAALARTYLAMGQYLQAGLYADSCLQLQPPLMDYNTLSTTAAIPITRFNEETIFYATSGGSLLLAPSRCKVDSALYRSYAADDLRKSIFFKNTNGGTHAFKGNYDGTAGSTIFSGLATDEIYLIRAECYARDGRTNEALNDLNTLLQTRYKAGTFLPLHAADAASALGLILAERRKELIFRGTRWTDLRRLNMETAYQSALVRSVGQATYQLPPNDLRYEFLIPQEVITTSGIAQNPR